ncbi:TagF domain-containing protein [Ruegeria marina]|uniref:Type VI secretion system protein ImpM n=1 Tax=Ruegeria marina TaxID=639004 RepID=A0A1G7CZX6_9RHOB|nr:TagF domain-containing protein [Ruegeria marina]SDE44025.1 type VI secretion system protein ImpM [Ruegeria marina]
MTGFFGKLPSHGDFVTRGLGSGVRVFLDRWLSLGPALALRDGVIWPEKGVRGLLQGPKGPIAVLVLASRDTPGRLFPFAACAEVCTDQKGVDEWAEQILPALAGATRTGADPDALLAKLSAFLPEHSDHPLSHTCVWCDGVAPEPSEVFFGHL